MPDDGDGCIPATQGDSVKHPGFSDTLRPPTPIAHNIGSCASLDANRALASATTNPDQPPVGPQRFSKTQRTYTTYASASLFNVPLPHQ
ncbi:uncharacterized protein THITE_157384 [Thermothielavioides terrestris NRRL 8126]|uniref:Uncharacterized protein n=1 Tax=Thermothielavioides terrestris (strain ATCC 38088 / NRRL 8126) TaxID=578455 RepID=G2RE33_THETT|nr:uncharacterized protein THITE_157384 [Thermothielavioides terrestris NRRL 8126]AEO70060.1 hypothetical protein THITE_157384 [Thermothielavioides terrestris NRRL 8126]